MEEWRRDRKRQGEQDLGRVKSHRRACDKVRIDRRPIDYVTLKRGGEILRSKEGHPERSRMATATLSPP